MELDKIVYVDIAPPPPPVALTLEEIIEKVNKAYEKSFQ